jgi:hypothetical protein
MWLEFVGILKHWKVLNEFVWEYCLKNFQQN